MKHQVIKFPSREGKEFSVDLKERVNKYFSSKGISTYANFQMVLKTIILLSVYFCAYAMLYTGLLPLWGMFAMCIIMGIGKSGIGFSVSHDAIHGAYSPKKWVNKMVGLTMNLIGGSDYVWKITHNVVHHTYTNIHEADEDLMVSPLLRLSPLSERKRVHRYQYIYFPFLYALTTLSWVFAKDYKKLFQKEIGNYDNHHVPTSELITVILTKLLYYTYTIVLPLIFLPIGIGQFFIGLLAMHFTSGIILGIVFQLAHVVEETEHAEPDSDGKMDNAWAIHQMRTTSDFGRTNKLLTWYVGGLNFQVEHHLFSNICSIHYPALSKILEQTAKDHNVPYHFHKTFREAVRSHINVLKNLGRGDVLKVA